MLGMAESDITSHNAEDVKIPLSFLENTELISSNIPIPPVASHSQAISPHTFHDFSIRLHKCREYTTKPLPNPSSGFIASTCCGDKKWTKDEVRQVISLQNSFFRSSTFIVKFSDRELNGNLIKKLNGSIKSTQFLQSRSARSCCVALKSASNRSEVLGTLDIKRFGLGGLSASAEFEEPHIHLTDIDPFTLFLDDIPLDMDEDDLLELFPKSIQISVGYTNKIYYVKRYVFAIYKTVRDAMSEFKSINKHSNVIVRFRLFDGRAHFPEENEILKCQKRVVTNGSESFPIFTDFGPPVYPKDGKSSMYTGLTIKTESSTSNVIVVGDGDDDARRNNNISSSSTDAEDTINIDACFENIMQAHVQMNKLPQMQ